MQIVIEISSYDKEWITNGYYIPEEINMRISEAIANGISIPEGHGRLIDADALIDSLSSSDRDIYCKAVIEEEAPTIIPAEKDGE